MEHRSHPPRRAAAGGARPIAAGDTLGGAYRVVRLLGSGGTGEVFETVHVPTGRRCAAKVLHAWLAGRREAVARFEREARAAARVGSPNICAVLDAGATADGLPFLVMELLEGETLAARLEREGPMAPARCVPVLIEVLDALHAAHAAGIVHRDLKPENVFLTALARGHDGPVKVLDFGASKIATGDDGQPQLTGEGVVVGTPHYLAPEQARAGAVDARTDVYAAGVTLYRAVSGRTPFSARTVMDLLFEIVAGRAAPLESRRGVDAQLAKIVAQAMARDPAHRFADAATFANALRCWLEGAAAKWSGSTS